LALLLLSSLSSLSTLWNLSALSALSALWNLSALLPLAPISKMFLCHHLLL
jgi:hypothetical protein